MLWGAMRYGYKFISIIWAVVLITSIHYYQRYMPWYSGYDTQLAITSSSYLVFSFIVNYMSVLATRQRMVVVAHGGWPILTRLYIFPIYVR